MLHTVWDVLNDTLRWLMQTDFRCINNDTTDCITFERNSKNRSQAYHYGAYGSPNWKSGSIPRKKS